MSLTSPGPLLRIIGGRPAPPPGITPALAAAVERAQAGYRLRKGAHHADPFVFGFPYERPERVTG